MAAAFTWKPPAPACVPSTPGAAGSSPRACAAKARATASMQASMGSSSATSRRSRKSISVPEAARVVVVDDADRLQEGVDDRGPDEAEAAPLQLLAERVGEPGARGKRAAARAALDRLAAGEAPQEPVEAAELALDREEGPGVRHRAVDLQAVAHDAGVLHEPRAPRGREARDPRGIEARERAAVGFALPEDRVPAEARLRALERDELEQHDVVVHGHAPLAVVVLEHGGRACPGAALHVHGSEANSRSSS